MTSQAPGLVKGLALAALLAAWALAAHHSSSAGEGSAWQTLLAVAPLAAAPLLLARSPWYRGLALITAAGILVAAWSWLSTHLAVLYFLQQVGLQLVLASVFGRTLRPGHTPLITQLALRIDGDDISPLKRRYTRGVTLAWTLFFLANAAVSTGLFISAPVAMWSAWANLLSGPLLVAMFAGEWLVRLWLVPRAERPRLADALRAYRAVARQRREGTS